MIGDELFLGVAVIPVLTIERAADAVPLARAFLRGGLATLEVTLRTPESQEAIRRIVQEVPEAVVGAGTILSTHDVGAARQAGARFLVSPGLTSDVAAAARGCGLAFLPGVATPSEIMQACEHGFTFLKFFPAAIAGGAAALRAFGAVFGGVRFCPTGGITLKDAPVPLSLPNVPVIGGSWMASVEDIRNQDWAGIARKAAQAAALRK